MDLNASQPADNSPYLTYVPLFEALDTQGRASLSYGQDVCIVVSGLQPRKSYLAQGCCTGYSPKGPGLGWVWVLLPLAQPSGLKKSSKRAAHNPAHCSPGGWAGNGPLYGLNPAQP